MILVIGGRSQGKRDYVCTKYQISRSAVHSTLGDGPVVDRLQDIVRELIASGTDALAAVTAHADAHPDCIYICDEVGCGVVPLEPTQREWREAVGRCCVMLARRADRVERIFCGLPLVLKESGGEE